jgi:hypothetical protein
MESFKNGIRTVSDNTQVQSKYIGNFITNRSFNFALHYIDDEYQNATELQNVSYIIAAQSIHPYRNYNISQHEG